MLTMLEVVNSLKMKIGTVWSYLIEVYLESKTNRISKSAHLQPTVGHVLYHGFGLFVQLFYTKHLQAAACCVLALGDIDPNRC